MDFCDLDEPLLLRLLRRLRGCRDLRGLLRTLGESGRRRGVLWMSGGLWEGISLGLLRYFVLEPIFQINIGVNVNMGGGGDGPR